MNQNEVIIMKKLEATGAKGFVRLFAHGITSKNTSFMVMQRLGPSLKQMIRANSFGKFSVKTIV